MCASRAYGLAGLASLVVAGCTNPTKVAMYEGPPPGTVVVSVATDPPVRADGTVPRNARFVVQLDGYPDPDAVGFGPITLRSGRANFDIRTEVDLVGQAVIVTPRSLLAPGQEYDVVVQGMVTLDDRVQEGQVVAAFEVGVDEGDPRPVPPRPTWVADVRPAIGTCAPFCHSPEGASGRMRTPTRELDLTGDPEDPVFGLIRVPSLGLRGAAVVLARVAPGDAARSVLLRKLIGGSRTADSLDPPYPSMRVDGRRMPIPLEEDKPATETVSAETLRLVQDWIQAGAPIE